MAKVSLRNMSGKKVGNLELKGVLFEAAPNVALMHQAVVAEQANNRQGTSDTKTRSEVRGGGRKPFRQKGTGRARQGTINAPQYYHGGIVFGPTPRSYNKALPKKMRRGAFMSAMSCRLVDEAIVVVDDLKMDKISTKSAAAFLASVGAIGKSLIVVGAMTDEILKSFRNIPGVELRVAPALSVRDLLNVNYVVMTKAAVKKLQEVYA
ncbi:MAG: 50S ribosomal protein L4 [Armatimonadetes bacterium]|nr:50S ribosomal protein L4 [Armatimonadota bacterium]